VDTRGPGGEGLEGGGAVRKMGEVLKKRRGQGGEGGGENTGKKINERNKIIQAGKKMKRGEKKKASTERLIRENVGRRGARGTQKRMGRSLQRGLLGEASRKGRTLCEESTIWQGGEPRSFPRIRKKKKGC